MPEIFSTPFWAHSLVLKRQLDCSIYLIAPLMKSFDDARLALQKLEEFVGMDDPDVVAAKTTLEREELLS